MVFGINVIIKDIYGVRLMVFGYLRDLVVISFIVLFLTFFLDAWIVDISSE